MVACSLLLALVIVWHGGLVYSKQFPSSVTETKLDAILFCSKANSVEYPEIDEPIRLREKHYPPARYMLNTYKQTEFFSLVTTRVKGLRAPRD